MSVLVIAPGPSGGTFYVKRNDAGELTYSIYSTGALPDSELEACRSEYPQLQFKTGD